MTETLHDFSEAEAGRAYDDKQDARYDGYWDARLHARLNGDTPERLQQEWSGYRPSNHVWYAKRRLHRTAAVMIGAILGLALAHIPIAANNPRTTAAVLIYVLVNVMVCGFFRAASRN